MPKLARRRLVRLLLSKDVFGVPESDNRGYNVRHNVLAEYPDVRWARSATRHRIARSRTRFVLAHQCVHLIEGPRVRAEHRRDPRQVFIGDDADGKPLEVMAIQLDDETLLVIHAMLMRERYRSVYEEAKKWRR